MVVQFNFSTSVPLLFVVCGGLNSDEMNHSKVRFLSGSYSVGVNDGAGYISWKFLLHAANNTRSIDIGRLSVRSCWYTTHNTVYTKYNTRFVEDARMRRLRRLWWMKCSTASFHQCSMRKELRFDVMAFVFHMLLFNPHLREEKNEMCENVFFLVFLRVDVAAPPTTSPLPLFFAWHRCWRWLFCTNNMLPNWTLVNQLALYIVTIYSVLFEAPPATIQNDGLGWTADVLRQT